MKINVETELDHIKNVILGEMESMNEDINNPEFKDEVEYMEGVYEGLSIAYNDMIDYEVYFKNNNKVKNLNK